MTKLPTQTSSDEQGFTLIEISIVIGMIAILAAVVIMAINPSRQFMQARNSQRTANVTAILNAVGQRLADGQGRFDGTVPGTTQACPLIASSTVHAVASGPGSTATNALDLSCLVPSYMPSFPSDPAAQGSDTGYALTIDANGRYTLSAPLAELGATIAVTR
jgi:prepilin-type N-terminal cleavage/methylation domain-containing protein